MKTIKQGTDCVGVSVGALIFNEKREILLSKRSSKTRNEQGSWEAPGGAVKFGETREKAIRREVMEELGVEIEILRELQTVDEILSKWNQHWVSTAYVVKIKNSQNPKIMEKEKSDKLKWFSITELPKPLSHVTSVNINEYKKVNEI